MLRSSPFVLALLLASSCACEDEQARNEAMLFLDRVQEYDADEPLETRTAIVDSIRALALTNSDVSAARDMCVDAYGSLDEAEEQHQLARHQLVEGIRLYDTEEQIPPDQQAQISAALARSQDALQRALEAVPRCTRAVGHLEHRFPRHRAGSPT